MLIFSKRNKWKFYFQQSRFVYERMWLLKKWNLIFNARKFRNFIVHFHFLINIWGISCLLNFYIIVCSVLYVNKQFLQVSSYFQLTAVLIFFHFDVHQLSSIIFLRAILSSIRWICNLINRSRINVYYPNWFSF